MLEIVFMEQALYDLGWWISNDPKVVKKIYLLLKNCCSTPYEGIGQPELLKPIIKDIGLVELI